MESVKAKFANSYVSFHIGCNNYQELNNPGLAQVKESHNDVEKLVNFFK